MISIARYTSELLHHSMAFLRASTVSGFSVFCACVSPCACVCDVALGFSDMPGPLETCWHTSCRHTCAYTYTYWSPPSYGSLLNPLAPRGLSVSDAEDNRVSGWRGGLGLGSGLFNMRSRFSCAYVLILRGLPSPLFLSFLGSGGHSSLRPWLESSNSRLCQKMGCLGCAMPHWTYLSHQEGWSLDTAARGVICSSLSHPNHP